MKGIMNMLQLYKHDPNSDRPIGPALRQTFDEPTRDPAIWFAGPSRDPDVWPPPPTRDPDVWPPPTPVEHRYVIILLGGN